MRKRSSYRPQPLTPGHITALSDQFICHPASRSIDKIEMAGEIMRDLLKQQDELLAALESGQRFIDLISPFEGDVTRQINKAIASVKGGAE